MCFQNKEMISEEAHIEFGTCSSLPTTFSLARETERGLDERKATIENNVH